MLQDRIFCKILSRLLEILALTKKLNHPALVLKRSLHTVYEDFNIVTVGDPQWLLNLFMFLVANYNFTNDQYFPRNSNNLI